MSSSEEGLAFASSVALRPRGVLAACSPSWGSSAGGGLVLFLYLIHTIAFAALEPGLAEPLANSLVGCAQVPGSIYFCGGLLSLACAGMCRIPRGMGHAILAGMRSEGAARPVGHVAP